DWRAAARPSRDCVPADRSIYWLGPVGTCPRRWHSESAAAMLALPKQRGSFVLRSFCLPRRAGGYSRSLRGSVGRAGLPRLYRESEAREGFAVRVIDLRYYSFAAA